MITSLIPQDLELYTKAKTAKGGITPTGEKNAAQVELDRLKAFAQMNKLRTDDNKTFQSDLYGMVEKTNPELIKQMEKKYGKTAKGVFADGLLGARTMFLVDEMMKPKPTPNPIQQIAPDKEVPKLKSIWAETGEPLFNTNKHILATMHYPVSGSKKNALIKFRNDFGYTGEEVELTDSEIPYYFGTTNTIQTPSLLSALMQKNKKKN